MATPAVKVVRPNGDCYQWAVVFARARRTIHQVAARVNAEWPAAESAGLSTVHGHKA